MLEETTQDDLTRELTRSELERLIAAGMIDADHREEVMAGYRQAIDWRSWVSRWTLSIGGIFLLTGVIFFFAWNWKELSPFARFAVLESAVMAAAIAALVAGIRQQSGQWLLLAASVFTGVLIAVYGQVYQTGADAFEVFALWSVLIVGWVLVSRFTPLWILWFAVVQTAIATWFGQVPIASGEVSWTAMYGVLGLVSVGFVALREWLDSSERFSWLRGEWIQVVLVATALFWLTLIPWEAIFDFRWRNYEAPASRVPGLIAWVLAVVGGALYFTRIRSSLTAMGLCVISGALILVVWFGKVIIDGANEEAFSFLLAAIVAILVFSGAALIIARAGRFIEAKKKAGEGGPILES